MAQPTATVNENDIDRIVARDFSAADMAEVLKILAAYGQEEYEREIQRVRAAILKLSDGSVEQVKKFTEWAKTDWRDVLGPAEYPEYSRRMFRIDQLAAEEVETITASDWQQYQEWFTR